MKYSKLTPEDSDDPNVGPSGHKSTWLVKVENVLKSRAAVYVMAFTIIYLLVVLIIATKSQTKRFSLKHVENVVSDDQMDKLFQKFINFSVTPFGLQTTPASVTLPKTSRTMRLPTRVQLTNHQTFELVEQDSNLATLYWEKWNENQQNWRNAKRYDNVIYCDQVDLKPPEDLKHSNLYWQVLEVPTANESFLLYLYNAYYDKRIPSKPMVKLITATDRQILVEKVVFRFEVKA